MIELPDRRWRDQSPAGAQSLLPKQKDKKQPDARVATWQTTIPKVPSWPEEPRPLHHHDWISYFEMVTDVLLVLLPLYFLLLGAAAIALHEKAVDDNPFGKKVEAAIQLGPTMFPIMFAAICGRSMKMIARYLAEKGAKLSTLELLMSSHSVWGTIESQFLMRRLTLVGGHLLLLWSLSPLGGQASLRLMGRGESFTISTEKWRYMSTGPGATDVGQDNAIDDEFRQTNALYAAAILAPTKIKTGPVDTWGHVKIPYLGKPAPEEWVVIKNVSGAEDYVSLVGIPVAKPRSSYPDMEIEFPLEASYLDLQCGEFKKVGPLKGIFTKENPTQYNFSLIESLIPGQTWQNMSAERNPFDVPANDYTFFFQTDLPLYPYDEDSELDFPGSRLDAYFGFQNTSAMDKLDASFSGPRTITLASRFGPSNSYVFNTINCSLSQEHVEAWVQCPRGNDTCHTQKIRKSRTDTRPSQFTAFEHTLLGRNFLQSFPQAIRSVRDSSTQTEQFLFNSQKFAFDRIGSGDGRVTGAVDLSSVPLDVFSRRLSTVFNTYFQLTIAPRAYTATLPLNLTAYGPDTLPFSDVEKYLPSNISATNTTYAKWAFIHTRQYSNQSGNNPFVGATTNATITSSKDIYTCNFAWLAVLWAVSGVVLVIGVSSLVLKRKTLGPDLFGYVASMTYENPYIRLPRGGSVLDAMERARLLRDVQVHVGDVRGYEEVGHVALAAGVPMRKLERGRLYM